MINIYNTLPLIAGLITSVTYASADMESQVKPSTQSSSSQSTAMKEMDVHNLSVLNNYIRLQKFNASQKAAIFDSLSKDKDGYSRELQAWVSLVLLELDVLCHREFFQGIGASITNLPPALDTVSRDNRYNALGTSAVKFLEGKLKADGKQIKFDGSHDYRRQIEELAGNLGEWYDILDSKADDTDVVLTPAVIESLK